uniref:Uncharacterized protein n=1 Tax=Aegilops tauschii subsp. strangulata TaxID=200361 RepID=A0A452YNV2_AEGTS
RTLEPRAGSESSEGTGQRPHPAGRGEPSWPWPPSRARPTPTTVPDFDLISVVVAAHDSTIFTHATPRPPPLAAPPSPSSNRRLGGESRIEQFGGKQSRDTHPQRDRHNGGKQPRGAGAAAAPVP